MNIENLRIDFLNSYNRSILDNSKKMSIPELFFLESKFNISYPILFKNYLSEIGLFQFDHSFYKCINDIEYYKYFINKDFISLLLNEGFGENEINGIDYDIITDKFIYPHKVQDIYELLNNDKDCIDIGVYLFDDTYNCTELLMLTGMYENYIVKESISSISDIKFYSYKAIEIFPKYLKKNSC